MRYEIVDGPVQRAQRVLIYGPEGIGKSTMASQMPDPIFIDAESGTGHLYVRRMPDPTNWDMMVDEVQAVAEDPDGASSVVIDSIDAAERMCQTAVCETAKKPSIESWGYGKGYVVAAERFKELLDALDACIANGVNVILIAHSQMRKFERPDEAGAYDRFEVKLNKHVASMSKEWADAVLFLDYETFVSVDDNGKGKASGGKRVIRTSHNVCWDAKNRWGLPDKLMLDEGGITKVRENMPVRDGSSRPEQKSQPKPKARPKAQPKPKTSAPKALKPLFEACSASGIKPDEVKAVMVAKGKREQSQPITEWEAPFVQWLVKQWPKVTQLVAEYREHHPKPDDVYDGDIPFDYGRSEQDGSGKESNG